MDPSENSNALNKARRAEFATSLRKTAETARVKRKTDLVNRTKAVESALAAYQELDVGNHPEIQIRREFVRLTSPRPAPNTEIPYIERRDEDLRTRPPLTQLIHRQHNGLAFYLTAIYAAHLVCPPGTAAINKWHNTFYRPSWALLTGMHTDSREARHRRVVRALQKLEHWNLVTAGREGKTGRFSEWVLNSENSSGQRYEVPGTSITAKQVVRVPCWFFYNGWHLVLEPREIATYLAIQEMTQSIPPHLRADGVALPTSVRWTDYGLSEDVYSSSIHELDDFGLIELIDPMLSHRELGKVSNLDHANLSEHPLMPYRFAIPSRRPRHANLSQKSALEVVLGDLQHEWPGRLYEFLFDPRLYR